MKSRKPTRKGATNQIPRRSRRWTQADRAAGRLPVRESHAARRAAWRRSLCHVETVKPCALA